MQLSAAAALAGGLALHPGASGEVLAAVVDMYSPGEGEAGVQGAEGVWTDYALSRRNGSARDAMWHGMAALHTCFPRPRAVMCAEGSWCSRVGVAAALRALAPQLSDEGDVPAALDFLIGSGLADADEKVREEMVAAGGAGMGGRRWCWLGSGVALPLCVC